MSDFDEKLKKALEDDDTPISELGREQSIFGEVATALRSRWGWMAWIAMIGSLVFFGLSIFFIMGVMNEDHIGEHTLYALGAGFSLIVVAMYKIWFWMQINRNSILREIVRLQVQVSELSDKLDRKT